MRIGLVYVSDAQRVGEKLCDPTIESVLLLAKIKMLNWRPPERRENLSHILHYCISNSRNCKTYQTKKDYPECIAHACKERWFAYLLGVWEWVFARVSIQKSRHTVDKIAENEEEAYTSAVSHERNKRCGVLRCFPKWIKWELQNFCNFQACICGDQYTVCIKNHLMMISLW